VAALRIGIFTSGGDAPGMNACIRAVVRTALPLGDEVVGIRRGYSGLLEEDFYYSFHRHDHLMHLRSVSNIIHRGGTILHTSRCERFKTEQGLRAAAEILKRHGIDHLLAIGGDGTFRGCLELRNYWDGGVIGCPGTIDNDLSGTDVSIGFTSAVSTAAEAVDKIRDTADATERLFLVEVMGRRSGQIAMYTALATGADAVLIPEIPFELDRVIQRLIDEQRSGKTSWIVIVAEGVIAGGVHRIGQDLKLRGAAFDTRLIVLGHLQRGGAPAVRDRVLASRMGAFAVHALREGQSDKMVGEIQGDLVLTPFEQCTNQPKIVAASLETLLTELAR
jgi:6-phosphofructokinase 1